MNTELFGVELSVQKEMLSIKYPLVTCWFPMLPVLGAFVVHLQ